MTAEQAWEVLRQADCLYTHVEVEQALDALAAAVTNRLADAHPLVVCVMNGGVVPFGKLLPKLSFPLQTDYVHATRYGRGLTGGDLHWTAGPRVPLRGRTVLLVDDILDEGITLAGIEARFLAEGARVVHKAVLVRKQRALPPAIEADFVGLSVPDRYVFGYGMDYKGYLRNAPGIYALNPKTAAAERA